MKRKAFLLAAPSSGSGKTTVTLALLRILARRGLDVQPFKCGPDYLDTALHTMAAKTGPEGLPGLNLDAFMASEGHVRELFARRAQQADVAVVEGVMGLFDGAVKADGSSAAIARLLNLPVIMVINGASMAYTAAAILYGFRNFDPSVQVAGVIFNRVTSAAHYRYLQEAALDAGVEPLGHIPASSGISISERHLGLNTSASYDREGVINAMADHIEKTVDVDRLLEIATIDLPPTVQEATPVAGRAGKVIAVAKDEAFSFIYHENLEVLARYGRLEFFSPMHDARLPQADLVYLAGGYPELHAETLAANTGMKQQIAGFCAKQGAVYGECGGLLYLGHTLHTGDGAAHAMCGVFDIDTTMQDARLTLGYRKVTLAGHERQELRGHEFHYSRICRENERASVARVSNARDEAVDTAVYRKGNAIASYIHLYWGENTELHTWLPGLE